MVKLINSHHNLSKKDIEDLENANIIELTNDYKKFLLKWNGGTPNPAIFMIPKWGGDTVMHYFHSIGDTYYNIKEFMDILEFRIPIGFVPIGNDAGGNAILLGTVEPHYDHIYFWDHENEPDLEEPDMSNMYFLADNIWEFLDSLYEDDFDEV